MWYYCIWECAITLEVLQGLPLHPESTCTSCIDNMLLQKSSKLGCCQFEWSCFVDKLLEAATARKIQQHRSCLKLVQVHPSPSVTRMVKSGGGLCIRKGINRLVQTQFKYFQVNSVSSCHGIKVYFFHLILRNF